MSSRQPSIAYRPHLDGLRAVAVLMVFVFHSNDFVMQGGFIGVDIFFVLSGYLITRVFLNRRETRGELGLAGFYARRTRRLLPAVIAMTTAVAVYEAVWGSVLDATTRVREIVATLLYVANWNLIAQADDYFAAAVAASPLRHTWSLAVEEQFYIVFPLILIAALYLGARHWKRTPLALGGLAALSTALMAALYSPSEVARAYYGTGTRAHQLLIGAVLGVILHRYHESNTRNSPAVKTGADVVAGLSLVGIVVMAMTLSGSQPFYFYGGSTLVALLTAALIGATELAPHGSVARLLSFRPAVDLGKVSYGFYLWHWPVILWLAAPISATFVERRLVNVAQFVVALTIALVSYHVIEKPVRERRGLFGRLTPRRTVALGLGVSITAAVFFGLSLSPSVTPVADNAAIAFSVGDNGEIGETPTASTGSGDTSTVPRNEAELELSPDDIAASAINDRSFEGCPDDPRPCVKFEPADDPAAPTVVLIGDSTAQAYDPAMKALAEEHGFRYVQAAVGGCPISHRLLATGSDGDLHKPSNFTCWDELPSIYSSAIAEWNPVLFIATSWNETNQHVEDGEVIPSGTREHHESVLTHLRETTQILTSDASVAFIDVLPDGPSVECLEVSMPNEGACVVQVDGASRERGYNALFQLLGSEDPRVVSISLTDAVCPDGECPLMIDGVVVRYDARHLTGTASRGLAPLIAERLAGAGIDLSNLEGLRN